MKNVIIAEKPSVAQNIAAIVGAGQRRDGYLEGNGYAVTWAFGHLVGLAMPEAYGFAGFRQENLPILPAQFTLISRQKREGKEYKDDPGVVRQLNIIKGLFEGGDRIIVATDAGREGELIFRYIYHYLGCTKPFVRLWISSLTDKAIREGMERLLPGSNYDNLYLSAKARSEADWLIGINGSQALSLAAGRGVFSLGRVQTPTLAMICSRYLENKSIGHDLLPLSGEQVVCPEEVHADTHHGGEGWHCVPCHSGTALRGQDRRRQCVGRNESVRHAPHNSTCPAGGQRRTSAAL